jgi:hypothetical protein
MGLLFIVLSLLGIAGLDDAELGGYMEVSQCVLARLVTYGGAVGYFSCVEHAHRSGGGLGSKVSRISS